MQAPSLNAHLEQILELRAAAMPSAELLDKASAMLEQLRVDLAECTKDAMVCLAYGLERKVDDSSITTTDLLDSTTREQERKKTECPLLKARTPNGRIDVLFQQKLEQIETRARIVPEDHTR